jgi:hypothetical protein
MIHSNPLRAAAWALFLGLSGLVLLTGCSSGSSSKAPAATAGAGAVSLSITDAPSDQWQEVSVVLKSASLRNAADHTWSQVWLADPAHPLAGKINLVDLNSVADLLSHASAISAGTYDMVQLVINTDPTTMTLVDDSGTTIPAAEISVIDPSGLGQINVSVSPAITVVAGQTTNLQLDFDLGHPLSIVEETIGGVTKVILNLQVRFKAMPPRVQDLQFARKLGQVTAVAAPTFTLTDARGSSFTYHTDASTLYADADAKAAGSFAGITTSKFALVDSNLNADGSLYARQVWYATTAAALPTFTPEGLVRRVNATGGTFSVLTKSVSTDGKTTSWKLQTVTVDAKTVWTFHTSVSMGTGTAFLQDIWRGCRVEVQFDPAGTTATAVNIQNARDGGFITAASTTGLTFGWPGMVESPLAMSTGTNHLMADPSGRTWAYYQNTADSANAFSWWFYGLPSAASPVVQDLIDTVTAAQAAHLPVNGDANLYWDTQSHGWQVYQLILAPEPLFASVITKGYADGATAGSGTMTVTYTTPQDYFLGSTAFQPLTVTLDYAGDLQTVVESIVWNQSTRVASFTVPVDHSQWSTLLVPPTTANPGLARIWVRPVKNGTSFDFHAYNVELISLHP